MIIDYKRAHPWLYPKTHCISIGFMNSCVMEKNAVQQIGWTWWNQTYFEFQKPNIIQKTALWLLSSQIFLPSPLLGPWWCDETKSPHHRTCPLAVVPVSRPWWLVRSRSVPVRVMVVWEGVVARVWSRRLCWFGYVVFSGHGTTQVQFFFTRI